MPMFKFQCPDCNKDFRRILKAGKDTDVACPDCGTQAVRRHSSVSTSIVERLDNGAMARAVERPSQAEKLYRERSRGKPPIG